MTPDNEAQRFLDAIRDPRVFCRGRVVSLLFSDATAAPTLEPNCGAADECPLFRNPQDSPVKLWNPSPGNPREGCNAYQALRQWNRSEQYWIVHFEGRAQQEVQASDPELAVCKVWWQSLRTESPISKWLLLGKRYTVRER